MVLVGNLHQYGYKLIYYGYHWKFNSDAKLYLGALVVADILHTHTWPPLMCVCAVQRMCNCTDYDRCSHIAADVVSAFLVT